ncbi:MAG TPA: DUF2059 domain-containing protein [Bauldia sp.]|nr:DUF2059 domain-containing protein [Bauldia sp.]
MSLMRLVSRAVVIAFAAMTIASAPAPAQEISSSHLKAAMAAIASAKASRGFDLLLPALSEKVQGQLIRVRPDLHLQITDVVEAVALKLVPRRADLDNDIARIWAKAFTEEELVAIAAFFNSPAGQKYSETAPRVIAESYQAAQNWSNRVEEEMLALARDELKKQGIEF